MLWKLFLSLLLGYLQLLQEKLHGGMWKWDRHLQQKGWLCQLHSLDTFKMDSLSLQSWRQSTVLPFQLSQAVAESGCTKILSCENENMHLFEGHAGRTLLQLT